MMKIAILGAKGMLGSMLVDYLSPYFEVVGTTRKEFNALNPDWEVLKGCQWVINAIGAIPQRYQDEWLMMQLNAVFPVELSRQGFRVIQITTDCVFSGEKGFYNELDQYDCTDAYGKSKHTGEVKAPNFYNLRCSIVGLEPEGNYSLLKKFLDCKEPAFRGYINHMWNGITTLAFARICRGIMDTQTENFFPNMQHIVPKDSASKFKLLLMAQGYFNKTDIEIQPVQHGMGIVDRRLSTITPGVNKLLWELAGYDEIPSIQSLIKELAEYKVKVLA